MKLGSFWDSWSRNGDSGCILLERILGRLCFAVKIERADSGDWRGKFGVSALSVDETELVDKQYPSFDEAIEDLEKAVKRHPSYVHKDKVASD
jgi:hypothetical protein